MRARSGESQRGGQGEGKGKGTSSPGSEGYTTSWTRVRLTRDRDPPTRGTESEGQDAGKGRGGEQGSTLALTERRRAERRASLPGHAAGCEAQLPRLGHVVLCLTIQKSQDPAKLTAHLPTVGRSHRPLCINARALVCTTHEEPATSGNRCCNACEFLRARLRRMRCG